MLAKTGRILIATIAGAALLGSTAAQAATTAAPPQQLNSWLALSSMSSPTVAASTVASLQSDYEAPRRGMRGPPLPALAVILATIALAVYIIASDEDDGGFNLSPD